MELTLTGIVLIPLTLVALLLPNIWTLSWVIFVSVLEAAAIIRSHGPGDFATILHEHEGLTPDFAQIRGIPSPLISRFGLSRLLMKRGWGLSTITGIKGS